jgi:hypothetical protein
LETSNRVRNRLRSSWEDWAPHRSPVAVPAVLPRRRRRLLRNEPANRFACSTVASRLESKGPSGTITNLHQRPRFPVHARKIRMHGLAAWQQLVVAAYIEKYIRIHNGPRASTFCLSNFTLFQPRIQTVIWNTAASLCHSTTDRARQSTAGRFGMVDCRNRSCNRLQPNEFVFGGVSKDHRNLSNRISPDSAMTPGVCGKGT